VRQSATIYVAGGATLIGAALLRQLRRLGFHNLCGLPDTEPDLTQRESVEAFFARHRPEFVVHAAGHSGGIGRNQRCPADLILHNLLVTAQVIDAAHRHGVKKLLYLGSSCSYPRLSPQPMRVEHLMSGPLEPTSECYAMAKIAGLRMCQAYRRQHGSHFVAAIPANAFGPGDDYDPENAHVIGALIRRMHEAKEQCLAAVTIWGTGTPRRDFIYADDLADACLAVLEQYDDEEPINLGSGSDISIAELAGLIRDVVGFQGRLEFDSSRPDGMPRKVLDGSQLAALGWRPKTPLREALVATYQDFLALEATRSVHA
jgi:GDP-L-fucose synthase